MTQLTHRALSSHDSIVVAMGLAAVLVLGPVRSVAGDRPPQSLPWAGPIEGDAFTTAGPALAPVFRHTVHADGERAPGVRHRATARGNQDNSFFIEEAYNQEPNVVQHIFNAVWTADERGADDERGWSFAFTQEWPIFSQAHQLSYTVPYSVFDVDGESDDGLGDVKLNYRFQALTESATRPAFAPRFSLVVPTGDEGDGFGSGVVGYEVNLPASKVVSDRWTVHGNAGMTVFPDVDDRDLVNYNLGASVIYAANPDLNLMLELVCVSEQVIAEAGRLERDVAVILSPGVRHALNLDNDLQVVVGLGIPIGLTADAPEYGVFLYLSFEHPFGYRP